MKLLSHSLNCEFGIFPRSFGYSEHKYCVITNADLSVKNSEYEFIGDPEDLRETQMLYFHYCVNTVEHIPMEIFEHFPALLGIGFYRSCIPVITNEMFSDPKFEKIHILKFNHTQTEKIGEYAFVDFKKLTRVVIRSNNLTKLKYSYFKNNHELLSVSISGREIDAVNPALFADAKKLQVVEFSNKKMQFKMGNPPQTIDFNRVHQYMNELYGKFEVERMMKVYEAKIQEMGQEIAAMKIENKIKDEQVADLKQKIEAKHAEVTELKNLIVTQRKQ